MTASGTHPVSYQIRIEAHYENNNTWNLQKLTALRGISARETRSHLPSPWHVRGKTLILESRIAGLSLQFTFFAALIHRSGENHTRRFDTIHCSKASVAES
jgi:hypothetical protein